MFAKHGLINRELRFISGRLERAAHVDDEVERPPGIRYHAAVAIMLSTTFSVYFEQEVCSRR